MAGFLQELTLNAYCRRRSTNENKRLSLGGWEIVAFRDECVFGIRYWEVQGAEIALKRCPNIPSRQLTAIAGNSSFLFSAESAALRGGEGRGLPTSLLRSGIMGIASQDEGFAPPLSLPFGNRPRIIRFKRGRPIISIGQLRRQPTFGRSLRY